MRAELDTAFLLPQARAVHEMAAHHTLGVDPFS